MVIEVIASIVIVSIAGIVGARAYLRRRSRRYSEVEQSEYVYEY